MAESKQQIVIVGGGAAGISTAASVLRRRANLHIAIIEPADTHYYQPGWTMVGGGIFDRASTARPMRSVMPAGVQWIKQAVAEFAPEQNEVVLTNGDRVGYDILVAAPGIKLDWAGSKVSPRPSARMASHQTTASTRRPTPGSLYRL